MSFPNWSISPQFLFEVSPVVPVLMAQDIEQVSGVVESLLANNIPIVEVTLRTPIALDAVSVLRQRFPQALIGVGTVVNPTQLSQAYDAGAQFAFCPGQTEELLIAGTQGEIPLIPGVASVSDLMNGLRLGYTHFKLFPAELIGGSALLQTFHQLFSGAMFCPTGGINAQNYRDYLALPNVSCVGGSWIVTECSKDFNLVHELGKVISNNQKQDDVPELL